jgi:hypothetical protein
MQYFCYTFGDDAESMPEPDPAIQERMGAFIEESTRSGVLVATGAFGPTALGAKITLVDGEYTVTDGPFAEAKELVGGWAIIDVPGRDEAVASLKRFLSILGQGEYRTRPVFGPDDAPPA